MNEETVRETMALVQNARAEAMPSENHFLSSFEALLNAGPGERDQFLCNVACPITGETALHVAAAWAQPGLIRLLLSSGIYGVEEGDQAGMSPLMYLAWFSSEPFHLGRISREEIVESVDLLLSHGADVEKVVEPGLASHQDNCWSTSSALGWAARSWNTPFIEAVMAYAGKTTAVDFEPTRKLISQSLHRQAWPTSPVSDEEPERDLGDSLAEEGGYVVMDARTWESAVEYNKTYNLPEYDIEKRFGHLRAEAQKMKLNWQMGIHAALCYIRQSEWAFGRQAHEYGQSAPGQQQLFSFYGWDFSATRLTLSRATSTTVTDPAYSNSALARANLPRWKRTVHALREGGARIALRRDVMWLEFTHLPTEALFYLVDLFVEQDPVWIVPWPSSISLPPRKKFDCRSLLGKQWVYDPIGIGTLFSFTLVEYILEARSYADLAELVAGFIARGLDVRERVHSVMAPLHSKASQHLRPTNTSSDVNAQMKPYAILHAAAQTGRLHDALKETLLRRPIPLLGFALVTRQARIAEVLLDAGMETVLPVWDDAWLDYMPEDAADDQSLKQLVDRLIRTA